ncbi:hypothetical protein BTZ20_0474 [Rhodococcus sp. MTM3W5.2]|nr:hypothetical protein BTZ20_0474 [Rhodococcus sp. MTM3W5.2]
MTSPIRYQPGPAVPIHRDAADESHWNATTLAGRWRVDPSIRGESCRGGRDGGLPR